MVLLHTKSITHRDLIASNNNVLLQRRQLSGFCGVFCANRHTWSSSHLRESAAALVGTTQFSPASKKPAWRLLRDVICQATSQVMPQAITQAITQAIPQATSQAIPHPGPLSTLAKAYKAGQDRKWQQKKLRANLPVLTIGGAVVAANLEQTPITGRWQFNLYSHSAVSCCEVARLPPTAELSHKNTYGSNREDRLQEQGLQLMQALYQTTAAGVNSLAATDTSLQARLCQIPQRIFLQHDVSNVCPQASLGLDRKGGPDFVHSLSASAGVVLQHQMPEELIWVVSHELAHAIAQHGNEHASWLQLGRLLLFAWFFLTPMGCWASFLAWPAYLMLSTGGNAWLSQHREYDADAMGAVISKAAGCSSAAIISSMQPFHANSMLEYKAQFLVYQYVHLHAWVAKAICMHASVPVALF